MIRAGAQLPFYPESSALSAGHAPALSQVTPALLLFHSWTCLSDPYVVGSLITPLAPLSRSLVSLLCFMEDSAGFSSSFLAGCGMSAVILLSSRISDLVHALQVLSCEPLPCSTGAAPSCALFC